MSNMAKNLFEYWDEDLRQRGINTTAHGQTIIHCPLMASAFTGQMVQQLIEAGPGKKADFICGGPIILILPRLAEHASANGIALQIEIHPTDRFSENPTSFIIHENEFAVSQGMTSTIGPLNVLIRVFPLDHLPPKTSFTSAFPKRDSVNVQEVLLELISKYRHHAGFTGPLPFSETGTTTGITNHSRPPAGMKPLAAQTAAFFEQVIDSEPQLAETFLALSKGNQSGVTAVIFGTSEGRDLANAVLMTTQNSDTDRFYKHCEKLGWMSPAPGQDLSEFGISMSSYQVTQTGRMGLSVLFNRLGL